MAGQTVIVGAGHAGLSCAVRLAGQGRAVRVLEAASHAGGRCRSFFDDRLETRTDNGNHILLSGNTAAFEFLEKIDAADTLVGPAPAEFPFFDLRTERRWKVRPNRGAIPWWVFSEARRVPGTRAAAYLKGLALAWAGDDQTVADVLGGTGALYEAFWEPFAVAVLNTAAEEASARLLWPVIREIFCRGEQFYRPRICRVGLSESFVDPAQDYLRERGVPIEFGCRVRGLDFEGDLLRGIDLGSERLTMAAEDRVVLAVPPSTCGKLIPGIVAPDEFRTIFNAHFRVAGGNADPEFLGVLGGVSQWIFRRQKVISVTVSAAESLLDADSEKTAHRVWREVSSAMGISTPGIPSWRLVKEKRATFAQTPEQVRRRPPTRTHRSQVFLAGDWTDTGLPATIEGAIRSGRAAAEAVIVQ